MITDPAFVPLTGSCRCGKVRFRMEDAPIVTLCCHCRFCQKVSGSAFRISAMIETDRLTLLEGEPQRFQGSERHAVLQCAACGLGLWAHNPMLGDGIAFVATGMLEHGERLPPEVHYFTRSRHPWVTLPSDVPAFEEHGDPGKAGAGERIAAALASGVAGHSLEAWTRGASTE